MRPALGTRSASLGSAKAQRSGFDRVARAYRWLEYLSFGPWLSRCREAQLGRMARQSHALLLGDGDGRFTAKLLRANSSVRIVALDCSAGMLAQLARRADAAGGAERLKIIHGDATQLRDRKEVPGAGALLDPSCGFDLVVSHFFLDCFSTTEVQNLARAVRSRVAPGGEWIISEFETPSPWARLLVALLYKGFALLAGLRTRRLPAYRAALEAAGFRCIEDKRWLRGLLCSTVWQIAGDRAGQSSGEATTASACHSQHAYEPNPDFPGTLSQSIPIRHHSRDRSWTCAFACSRT